MVLWSAILLIGVSLFWLGEFSPGLFTYAVPSSGIDLTGMATADCHAGKLGSWAYACSPECPCGEGEGDCDSDADCLQGLSCNDDRGSYYGWDSGIDVCEGQKTEEAAPPSPAEEPAGASPAGGCHQGQAGTWSYVCSPTCLCYAGEGDCDSDLDCGGPLVCLDGGGKKYGFDGGIDTCEPPESLSVPKKAAGTTEPKTARGTPGSYTYCSRETPCGPGEGHCSGNDECTTGVCLEDVGSLFGVEPGKNFCVPSGSTYAGRSLQPKGTTFCCGGCVSNCAGKECGTDGCGGTCGTCPQGRCQSGKCVNAPSSSSDKKEGPGTSISGYSCISSAEYRHCPTDDAEDCVTWKCPQNTECNPSGKTARDICLSGSSSCTPGFSCLGDRSYRYCPSYDCNACQYGTCPSASDSCNAKARAWSEICTSSSGSASTETCEGNKLIKQACDGTGTCRKIGEETCRFGCENGKCLYVKVCDIDKDCIDPNEKCVTTERASSEYPGYGECVSKQSSGDTGRECSRDCHCPGGSCVGNRCVNGGSGGTSPGSGGSAEQQEEEAEQPGGSGSTTCSETDGGRNIYTYGTITYVKSDGTTERSADYCLSSTYLVEKYCENGRKQETGVTCPSGYKCFGGRCKESEAEQQEEEAEQPGGSGSTTCSETDGGRNIYTYGTITYVKSDGTTERSADYCLSSTYLVEKYCENGRKQETGVTCPSGYTCSGGRCKLASSGVPGGGGSGCTCPAGMACDANGNCVESGGSAEQREEEAEQPGGSGGTNPG